MIIFRSLSLVILSTFVFNFCYADFKIPRLTSPVIDQAHLLPPSHKGKLERALKTLYKSGGSQIQVLTLKELDGLSIEQASIQIVDHWKLGNSEKDNGVLLLVAQKEKRIRIEVGQGLEGSLTDAYSNRIINETMVPLFRAGHPESAILLGVINIVEKTDPQFPIKKAFEGQSFRSQHKAKKEKSLISRIFSILFLIFMIIMFIRNPMLFLLLLSGSGRGGHGGGFGGGGGGWSGGGGGFSGGGSSGGW